MTPEEHNLLKEVLKHCEDNSIVLEKLNSERKWRRFLSTLYSVIIIGISVGAYYYVEPLVSTMLKFYQGFSGQTKDFGSVLTG